MTSLWFTQVRHALTKYGHRVVFRCGHKTLEVLASRKVAWGPYQPRRIRGYRTKYGWKVYADLTGLIHLRLEYSGYQDRPGDKRPLRRHRHNV